MRTMMNAKQIRFGSNSFATGNADRFACSNTTWGWKDPYSSEQSHFLSVIAGI